jgi:hypothetical protein
MEPHAPPQVRPHVTPHVTLVVVWDTPSAVECGAAFHVKVGVKCAVECGAAVRRVEIRDEHGRSLASGAVGDVPWTGTSGLHFADVELRAPESPGLHAWEACVAEVVDVVDVATGGRTTHGAANARFQVRAVPAPECLLKVIAVDARSGTPIPAAKVVVHPYRAITDASGVAEIRVPKGPYRLFVSGRDRFPFRRDGEIGADVTIRAELDVDFGPSDAELWS